MIEEPGELWKKYFERIGSLLAKQPSLLFAGLAYNIPGYIDMYLSLPADPDHPEVIRNLPIRHPVIWMDLA